MKGLQDHLFLKYQFPTLQPSIKQLNDRRKKKINDDQDDSAQHEKKDASAPMVFGTKTSALRKVKTNKLLKL